MRTDGRTDGQTDRQTEIHDESNRRFSQLCESAQEFKKMHFTTRAKSVANVSIFLQNEFIIERRSQ